jgi:hypothetical protein
MSKQLTAFVAVAGSLLATAAAPLPAVAATGAAAPVAVQRAGLFSGRGLSFGRRSYGSPYRYGSRYRSPYAYRRGFHPFGGFLKVLGIAYLFHALFGWGSGGSPVGLIILLAFLAWLVTRRRRRPFY